MPRHGTHSVDQSLSGPEAVAAGSTEPEQRSPKAVHRKRWECLKADPPVFALGGAVSEASGGAAVAVEGSRAASQLGVPKWVNSCIWNIAFSLVSVVCGDSL
jgi:hypothetical protein